MFLWRGREGSLGVGCSRIARGRRGGCLLVTSTASGGELRALSRQAMRWYARYWLEAFRVPVVPVDRLVGVPVDQRGPVTARYREAAGRVAGPGVREAA